MIPVYASDRAVEVARASLRHVDELVLVEDGAPCEISRSLDALADDERVRILRLPANAGKGSAVAAGATQLLSEAAPPEAIIVLDSDGQHDPERIPAFLEAARHADVVIGDRRDRRAMPLVRRVGNRAASLALLAASRTWVPDTQNGMRLFRTAALRDVPTPDGGYESESRHLRSLLGAGQTLGFGRDPHDLRRRAEPLPSRCATPCGWVVRWPGHGRAAWSPRQGAGAPRTPARSCAGGAPGSPRRCSPRWRSAWRCPCSSRSTTRSTSP